MASDASNVYIIRLYLPCGVILLDLFPRMSFFRDVVFEAYRFDQLCVLFTTPDVTLNLSIQ